VADYTEQATRLEGLAAFDYGSGNFGDASGAAPERIVAGSASASFLPLLGVGLARGRWFTQTEDAPGNEHVMVLAHGFWQRRFGGADDVLGKTVRLDNEPYVIIGILPASFAFPAADVDAWTPWGWGPEDRSEGHRGAHMIKVIARLLPGTTL